LVYNSAQVIPGELQLFVKSESLLVGIYKKKDGIAIHFKSQPRGLNITSTGSISCIDEECHFATAKGGGFEYIDYGAFVNVRIDNKDYILGSDSETVMDVTGRNIFLPQINLAVPSTDINENDDFLRTLING